jgi:acyl-coenzyme A thioesterase PaaI-like protein
METQALRNFRIPAWITAGLHDPVAVDGRITAAMSVGQHLRRSDGTLNTAVLAAVADGCLGLAVMSGAGFDTGMVTSHLHLEFPRHPPRELVTAHCTAAPRTVDRTFGLGEATITDPAGVILAYATLGGVLVPRPEHTTLDDSALDVHVGAAHLDELLGTRIEASTPEGVCASFRADAALANLYRNLHGGLGTLIGARILDAALDTEGRAYRLADLRAVFTRSIPADGNEIRCRATILHRGRRMAVGRAELFSPDGRVALGVDATYVACDSEPER